MFYKLVKITLSNSKYMYILKTKKNAYRQKLY